MTGTQPSKQKEHLQSHLLLLCRWLKMKCHWVAVHLSVASNGIKGRQVACWLGWEEISKAALIKQTIVFVIKVVLVFLHRGLWQVLFTFLPHSCFSSSATLLLESGRNAKEKVEQQKTKVIAEHIFIV